MSDDHHRVPPPSSPTEDIAVCHNPVFILTASRSGSTLLRFILDTHPELACPPETMITAACVSLLRSWDILENAGLGRQRLVSEPPSLPAAAVETVRGTVDRLYGHYLARRGKPRWCDKSLDTFYNAGLLAQLYPQARFVCLYRHCMDVIASGVEVCPWGVSRFGFDAYVAQHPGNSVAAIGNYWLDCARVILEFEEAQPERCHRIRYEDLATAPEEIAADLLEFLGVAPMPGITAACFEAPHEGDGPGDEKIWFTKKVTTETLGRGINVPAAALPPDMREQINDVLGKLGYRAVGEGWNEAPGPLDPRLEAPDRSATSHEPVGADTVSAVVGLLTSHISARTVDELNEAARRWPALAGETMLLVVTDGSAHEELTLQFPQAMHQGTAADDAPAHPTADPAVRVDAPGLAATVIGSPETWQAILTGKANLITEIRRGRLRCINKRDAYRVRSDEIHAIAWLLGVAQVPLVRQEEAA